VVYLLLDAHTHNNVDLFVMCKDTKARMMPLFVSYRKCFVQLAMLINLVKLLLVVGRTTVCVGHIF